MKPIDGAMLNVAQRLQSSAVNRTVRAEAARATGGNREAGTASAARASSAAVQIDAGQPPVDTDRVAMIRQAVENGKYPVVPARIADAMIAAGYLLRTRK